MTDRIKLEDMTLGQIQGLKKQIADEVNDYLIGLTAIVHKKFDVGGISISVSTDIDKEVVKFESTWDVEKITHVNYDIKIKFSKEDEIFSK